MSNINDVKQAITGKLIEIYPSHNIYDEDLPQDFVKPSFLIQLTEQTRSKRMSEIYNSVLTFDIAYYSAAVLDIRKNCLDTQEVLLKEFNNIGSYRASKKQAKIVENVLHFTFTIKFAQVKETQETKMQQPQLNTRMEE